jgi:hypothetical protein
LPYMCIHCLHHIYPLISFPRDLPCPSNANLPFHPSEPVLMCCSWFCRRKNKRNMAFLLVWDKDSYVGASLCCSNAYVYYSPNWVTSSSPLHSSLVCFPWWSKSVYNFYIYFCTVNASSIFRFLVSFPCPIPPGRSCPWVWPMSHKIAAFALGLLPSYEGEHATFLLLSLTNFT